MELTNNYFMTSLNVTYLNTSNNELLDELYIFVWELFDNNSY